MNRDRLIDPIIDARLDQRKLLGKDVLLKIQKPDVTLAVHIKTELSPRDAHIAGDRRPQRPPIADVVGDIERMNTR